MGILLCKQEEAPQKPAYDFYRSSGLRYMGFASVAASRMVPSPFTQIPQMAATAYIFSDVFSKAIASVENDDDPKRTAVIAGDALLWHSMASVAAPLLLYGSLRSVSKLIFVRQPKCQPMPKPLPKKKKDPCAPHEAEPESCKPAQIKDRPVPAIVNILPGVICLALMPFIVKPLHEKVDEVLDLTYRPWAESYLKANEVPKAERLKLEKERRRQAELEEKERQRQAKIAAAEKCKQEEQARKEAEKLAKQKAKEEELAKAQRLKEEKEAKARAKQKCLEEDRLRREQLAAEEKLLREKLKQEELELAEKKAKMDKEFKEKAGQKMNCD